MNGRQMLSSDRGTDDCTDTTDQSSKSPESLGIFLTGQQKEIDLKMPVSDDDYGCLLCDEMCTFTSAQFNNHKRIHRNNFLGIGKYIILLCKKNCSNSKLAEPGDSHYHCPFCEANLKRKKDARKHMDHRERKFHDKDFAYVQKEKKPEEQNNEKNADRKHADHDDDLKDFLKNTKLKEK